MGPVVDFSEKDILTDGDYRDEDSAKAAFISAIELVNHSSHLLNVYSEVECSLAGNRFFANRVNGRIDFVLTPTKKLLDLGWMNGFIGVEVKKSGHKASAMIHQMIDYSSSIFRLDNGIMGAFGLVVGFPSFRCSGSSFGLISSILSQNRLATCSIERGLSFSAAGTNYLRITKDGTVRTNLVLGGYKTGSR